MKIIIEKEENCYIVYMQGKKRKTMHTLYINEEKLIKDIEKRLKFLAD